MLEYIGSLLLLLLLLPSVISLILFYKDNEFSKVDIFIFVFIFIFIFIFCLSIFISDIIKHYYYYNYYYINIILFYVIFFYIVILYYIYLKIKYRFKNINLNEISLIFYMSAFLFFLCFIWIPDLDHDSRDIFKNCSGIALIIYYLLFPINLIIRARAFINKRRNKIKEENPHDKPKNPETVKILEDVMKQRRGE
ncbi:hypothetical protein BKH42_08775 [Helicobacter sp. 13S00482-2]|nr:hypothetical protein BKH42_08775 [Helicobacter sp. 13S00482-2]